MVVPPDESALRSAHALADIVKGLASAAAEENGTRDVARWLADRTSASKDSWHRRFTHKHLIDYGDIVEVAALFGLTPAALVQQAEDVVGASRQDGARVTPITRKRPEEMTAEELEQERSAATHDETDPREYPEG